MEEIGDLLDGGFFGVTAGDLNAITDLLAGLEIVEVAPGETGDGVMRFLLR